jgi:ABC-type nitrate/sulfonate/bicarbonate transport system permease component
LGVGEAALTFVAVIAGWIGFLQLFNLNPYFAKTPAQVWAYLVSEPGAAADRNAILRALGSTALVATPGYLAGLALGVGAAALFELAPAVRRTMTPVAVALRCVPIIAIAPLLVQALGRGPFGTTSVVALMTFFPTLVASLYGLRQAPGHVTDFFDVFATPSWRVLLLARIPAMAPAFFSAARIAAPSAILAATVAEWLATGTGIGNYLAVTAATSKYAALWSSVVVVTIAAVAVYWVVELIERAVLSRIAPEQTR